MAWLETVANLASNAIRPASTAILNAFAIKTGLEETAMAVLTKTASAPSSMAYAA